MASLRKNGLLFFAAVLVAALVYVAHEVQSLSANEAMLEEAYDRQLEAILYSVNQHAWDVANSWANTYEAYLLDTQRIEELSGFFEEVPTVEALFLADTLGHVTSGYGTTEDAIPVERSWGTHQTEEVEAIIGRLLERKRAGYRQLYPVLLDQDETRATIALLFVPEQTMNEPRVAAMIFTSEKFIDDVLKPKMQEVAREKFVVTLSRAASGEQVFTTGAAGPEEARQQRQLWLFPDYVVGIRAPGESLDTLLRARFYRSLGLIGLLTIVLFGGAFVVYRNVRRQVELARMKSTFVSNVSHELRTPLALIRMFAETLEMGRVRSDEQRNEYYRIISHETERLSRLVNNILNFSRIEAGQKTYAAEPVALNEVVRGVLDAYAFNLQNHGFDTTLRLHDPLPPLRGDGEAIAEALINLLDNAVKYSKAERRVEISTGIADGQVFVEVADRGIGIPPEEQRKIFEQFYRVSNGLVHDTQGTGLGLALVRHIAEAHGGAVSVRSRPGEGSAFRLTFPVPAPVALPQYGEAVTQPVES